MVDIVNTKIPPGEICMLQKDFTKNVERHLYSKVRSHLLVAFNFGEQYASCWHGTNKEIKGGIFTLGQLYFNSRGNQGEVIKLCSTLLQIKRKTWDWNINKLNTCLKPEPADWFTACLNRDIPGKEEKGYLRKRGKEICQEKRKKGIEEKRCPWKRGNLSKVLAGSLSSIGNEFTKIYRHKKARISMLK